MGLEKINNSYESGNNELPYDSSQALTDLSETVNSKRLLEVLRTLIDEIAKNAFRNTTTDALKGRYTLGDWPGENYNHAAFQTLINSREREETPVEAIVQHRKDHCNEPYAKILLLALCKFDLKYCSILQNDYQNLPYKDDVLVTLVNTDDREKIRNMCYRQLTLRPNSFPLDLYKIFVGAYGIHALFPMSKILNTGSVGYKIIGETIGPLLNNLHYRADQGTLLEMPNIFPDREIALKYGSAYIALIEYIYSGNHTITIGTKQLELKVIATSPTVIDGILGQLTPGVSPITPELLDDAIRCFEQDCTSLIEITHTNNNLFLLRANKREEEVYTDDMGLTVQNTPFSKNRNNIMDHITSSYQGNSIVDGSYRDENPMGGIDSPVGDHKSFKNTILTLAKQAKQEGKNLDIMIGLHSIGIPGLYDTLHRKNGPITHDDFYTLSQLIEQDPDLRGLTITLTLFSCTTPLDFSRLTGFSSIFLDSSFQNATSNSYSTLSNYKEFDFDEDGTVSFGETKVGMMINYTDALMPAKFITKDGRERSFCNHYGQLGSLLDKIEHNKNK